jgi:hypothetical protein
MVGIFVCRKGIKFFIPVKEEINSIKTDNLKKCLKLNYKTACQNARLATIAFNKRCFKIVST